jgi:hypothetical protein
MTTPSARGPSWSRFQQRIACEITGVGVVPSAESTRTVTPLGARTSSAVRSACSERARVSCPRKSDPVAPCAARCSQIACVVARMWASLKLDFSEEPRCLEVPRAMRCLRSAGSGRSVS